MAVDTQTVLYGLTLALSICEVAFGFGSAFSKFEVFSPSLDEFALVAGVVGTLTAVWVSILLSRLKRPNSAGKLARASVHFYSWVSIVIIWLAVSIMNFAQIPHECRFDVPSDGLVYSWCGLTSTIGVIGVLISGLATTIAFRLWRLAARAEEGMSVNVAVKMFKLENSHS